MIDNNTLRLLIAIGHVGPVPPLGPSALLLLSAVPGLSGAHGARLHRMTYTCPATL
jgi:hypothetical protein